MRIDSYIELRKLLGVSGLFSVNTSAGVIEGNSDYTRTEFDGVTVFEYTLDGVRLTAEFSEKANGAIIRQDYFENTSDAPVHIYKIASRFHMDGNEYDVYTQYNGWQNENKGGWQRLVTQVTTAGLGIRTCEGAAPIMALHSKYTGKNTVFHLLPNGQWSMTAKKFSVSKNEHVVVEMGLHDDCLDLTVAPGERIALPTVIFFTAESKVDLDAYKLHEVYNELYPRRELPIFYNSWLYCFDKLDIDKLLEQVDAAADLGFEGFMIDAGWFGDGSGNWFASVGDWEENTVTGPAGRLIELSERARERGMMFGLWFEPERAGRLSKNLAAHPEYFIANQFLDFANPEALDYIVEAVSSQIEKYSIGWVKFDFNASIPADPSRGAFYRYMQGQFEFMKRLHERFPNLYITNCASGGARMELEQAKITDSFWFTDNQGPYEGLRIIKDSLKRLPTALIERWTVEKYCEGVPNYEKGTVGKMIHCNNATWTYLVGIEDSYAEAFAKGGPIGFSCDVAAFPEEYKKRWSELFKEYKREREFYRSAVARILVDTDQVIAIEYSDPALEKCVIQVFTKLVCMTSLVIYPAVDVNAEYMLGETKLSGNEIKENGINIENMVDNSAQTLVLTKILQ